MDLAIIVHLCHTKGLDGAGRYTDRKENYAFNQCYKSPLNHGSYIKCEREKRNLWFPAKRCLVDYGPVRERKK